MRVIYKSKSFIIFNALVFLAVVFTMNYCIGNYKLAMSDQPYDLTENFKKFQKTMTDPTKDKYALDDVLKANDKNFVLILEKENGDEIGLYDPWMYFYIRATSAVMPNIYRYFSDDDYIYKKNVGICINGCTLFDDTYLKTLSEEENTDIINCFETSPLADQGASIAKNLFSMKEEVGDHIYLDSEDQDAMDVISNILLQAGFEKVDVQDKSVEVTIITAIKYGMEDLYSFYLIISTATLLLFCFVVCYIYVVKMKRRIVLDYINGGTRWNIFRNHSIPLFITIFISCLVMTAIMDMILNAYFYLSVIECFIILCFYMLYFFAIYWIDYNFIVMKQLKRGYDL